MPLFPTPSSKTKKHTWKAMLLVAGTLTSPSVHSAYESISIGNRNVMVETYTHPIADAFHSCTKHIFGETRACVKDATSRRELSIFAWLLLPYSIFKDLLITPFAVVGSTVTGVGALGESGFFLAKNGVERFSESISKTIHSTKELNPNIVHALKSFQQRLTEVKDILQEANLQNEKITLEQLYLFALAGTIYDSQNDPQGVLTLADGVKLSFKDLPATDHEGHQFFSILRGTFSLTERKNNITHKISFEGFPERKDFILHLMQMELTHESTHDTYSYMDQRIQSQLQGAVAFGMTLLEKYEAKKEASIKP